MGLRSVARCPPGDQWGVVFLRCWYWDQCCLSVKRTAGWRTPWASLPLTPSVLCGQHTGGKRYYPEGPCLRPQSPWCCTNVQSFLTPLSLRQLSYPFWHGCPYFLSLLTYRQLHFWICFTLFFICAVCCLKYLVLLFVGQYKAKAAAAFAQCNLPLAGRVIHESEGMYSDTFLEKKEKQQSHLYSAALSAVPPYRPVRDLIWVISDGSVLEQTSFFAEITAQRWLKRIICILGCKKGKTDNKDWNCFTSRLQNNAKAGICTWKCFKLQYVIYAEWAVVC